ncbi:MAG: hypothetical protein CUN56_14940 [Phototrophicales bacterium]|nr:MAG: hypothetical protein CUN56_14940 [Phototrophicales bacterium]
MWPKVREQLPDAELHIFYGWKTFYETHKKEPAMLAWMNEMKRKMEQPGIVNHGRVGQAELARHMADSTLWLYPTMFPEIHCITALEMQAAGVYPITTGYAALAETQQSGIKIDGDPKSESWRERFLNEITLACENPDILKKELEIGRAWAKENDWDKITDVWLQMV